MEEKKDSRRVKMTKRMLKESLINLMKESSVHDITIKEICENADVNRSTFYRHYQTQYDLYNEIIDDIAADISEIFEKMKSEGFDTVTFLVRVLEYIEARREVFLVILSDKGNINIGEAYTKMTEKVIGQQKLSELGSYIAQFISAGMTSILWSWLSKENRRSATDVALLLHTFIKNGLSRAIEFSLK